VLYSARSFLYETVAEAWARTTVGQASTKEEKVKLMLAAAHLMQSSVAAVDHVSSVAGTSGIDARSPMERVFWDIHTVRHHGWVSESLYGMYSQMILGLELDFPVATFGEYAETQ
jgi:hypothetical protein